MPYLSDMPETTSYFYEPYRYKPSRARRFGTGLLRRALKLQLGRPFADATSGMYAAAASAFPFLAQPYTTGAPEVQGLLRLADAGLVVEEVPVNMRERASGESRISGKKAVSLVLTLTGTILLYRWMKRRP